MTPYQRTSTELLASGQPRAYADHQRIYAVTLEEYGHFKQEDGSLGQGWHPMPDDRAIETAKRLVNAPKDKQDRREGGERGWWESYTDYARLTGPGKVEIRIVTPFTD